MKKILLTQGAVAMVDDADFEQVNRYRWCLSKDVRSSYAMRRRGNTRERMHRFILGLSSGNGLEVDHIDDNGLNNQKSNLRICSRSENKRRARKRSDSQSPYKGVRPPRKGHRWEASIEAKGKRLHLGSFTTAEEAAHAYDRVAIKLFGKFARLNFPVEVKDA